MHLITTHNQVVCNVMAGLTKTFISPDIILQNLEAITACSSWTKACMEKLLRTNTYTHTHAFTHRSFYTQTLLHTEAFLHTNTFTHRPFYTQTLLHRNTFTHKRFYTQTVHNHFYTQTLLHTEAFTHRPAHVHAVTVKSSFWWPPQHFDGGVKFVPYIRSTFIHYSTDYRSISQIALVAIQESKLKIK